MPVEAQAWIANGGSIVAAAQLRKSVHRRGDAISYLRRVDRSQAGTVGGVESDVGAIRGTDDTPQTFGNIGGHVQPFGQV